MTEVLFAIYPDDTGGGAGTPLLVANNLSDVASPSSARSNLGLAIGSNVQAWDVVLDDLSGLTLAQGDILYYNGTNLTRLAAGASGDFLKTQGAGANPVWATIPGGGDLLSTNNLSDVADAATSRQNLGLEIGVDVQAFDATLAALAAYNTNGLLTQTAADTFTGRTVTGTANQITVTNGNGVAGNPTLSLPADVLIPTVLTVPNTGLHILDTNASHDLIIAPGSDLTADHTLTLTTGDADRTLTLSGSPTLGDWFDQSVKTTANPQFATIELGAASDTTLSRVSAGVIAVEGVTILTTASGQPLDATLTALAAYNTNGLLAQTAADTFAGRTITATANETSVSNGNGVSGNPTIGLAADILVATTITVPNTGLHVLDTNASHDLIFKPGSDLTADHTLTLTTGDADRTLTISGNATVSQDYSTTGNPQFATIELGAASDTTLSRSAAGKLDVEGHTVLTDDEEDQTLSGGARVTVKDLGNLSGSTITPDPGDRPIQKITNNGAGTIAPGSNVGSYILIVKNDTGAGAITTSGWQDVSGESFDTTTTSEFVCHATITGDLSALVINKVA